MTALELDTPHGLARAHIDDVGEPAGALVLGHGAAGGVSAPDLAAAAQAAREARFSVALVEQPYHVAGRRSVAPPHQLDAAWIAVVEQLRAGAFAELPLVAGGRSSGARVACRTAGAVEAIGVLCLAFPLHPPGKAGDPSKSRQPELDAVTVPVLVVQGASDPFGHPGPGPHRRVVKVPGSHSLRTNLDRIQSAVREWLDELR